MGMCLRYLCTICTMLLLSNYMIMVHLQQIRDACLEPRELVILCSFLIIFGIVLEHLQVVGDPSVVPFGPHRECEVGHYRVGRQGAAIAVMGDLHLFSVDLRMDVDLDVA